MNHLVLAILIVTSSVAGGANENKPTFKLRCTQQLSNFYAATFTATSRNDLEDMRAAMLRRGTITQADFCVTTVEGNR